MARTCNPSAPRSLRQVRNATKADVVPKLAKKGATKAISKAKESVTAVDVETESANVVENKDNALKRTYEAVDNGQLLTATSRKARKVSVAAEVVKEAVAQPARRSVRTQPAKPIVKKRKRRTKAEIEADKEKAEAEKKKKDELIVEKERAMSQMNNSEDKDRAEAAMRAIRTFTELDAISESGEEFDGIDEVTSNTNTEDEEVASDGAVDVEKLKKANKAMENAIKALKKRGGGSPKKSLAGGKKFDKSGKKPAFASGLRPGWDNGKNSANDRTHVEISAGGLSDSDADAINPFLQPVQPSLVTEKKAALKFTRNYSRQNEMVVTIKPSSRATTAPAPRPQAKRATVKATSNVTSNPVPIKAKKRREVALSKDDSDYEPEKELKGKRLCGNNVRMTDLPEFATGKWRNTFLPTLYDTFFTSTSPFDSFYVGTTSFVKILQGVVEEVYPEVDYTVTALDSIHFLAYNRINEKRSSLGSNAIKLLEAHVGTLSGEKAAKEWLRWCIWPGGPLLFKVPSPIHCEEPSPEGRLLSPFVIALTKPLLKLRAGSILEQQPPQGLVALVAAALERAARYLYNPKRGLTEFSKDAWGAHAEAYWKSFQPNAELGNEGVERERWDELVDLCSEKSKAEEDLDLEALDADLSILDDKRPLIFNFRSPSKLRH